MRRKIPILLHKKNPTPGYLISYFADIWRKEGNEVIFLFGIKKLVRVDINKTTGMETASYTLKLKPFDNPRAGGIYSYF